MARVGQDREALLDCLPEDVLDAVTRHLATPCVWERNTATRIRQLPLNHVSNTRAVCGHNHP
jgi:hypothetical protein